jgi:pyridoxal phosphate enzyme (YggS family)
MTGAVTMLKERVDAIRQKITTYCEQSGRSTSAIRLIAVSKTFGAENIRQAYDCGLRDFGENYADELLDKYEKLQDLKNIRWVFIGQLQSNKIQKIVRAADEIQSIASEKHARYVERYAKEFGKKNLAVWIVVNAGDEETKQGVSITDLPMLADFITTSCPHLSLQGLMAIPPAQYADLKPISHGGIQVPELYSSLRKAALNVGLGKLSLGMSNDLGLAISAGTDCVRIGSAIFGERK